MKQILALLIVFFLVPLTTSAQDACEGNFDYDQDVDGTDAAVFKADFGRSPFQDPCPVICEGTLSAGGRWCDQGNGTVKDMTTGLVWLKNTSCMGRMNWYAAIEQPITNLRNGDCSLTDGSVWGDWRLPTYNELDKVWNYIYWEGRQHPFIGLLPDLYWTSTTLPGFPDYAELLLMQPMLPWVFTKPKLDEFYVWPVRGGQ